jgi:hypothetical protein
MKTLATLTACLALAVVDGQGTPNVTLSSRLLGNGTRSLLVHVAGPAGTAIDEIRIELPRNAAEQAVALGTPTGWKVERDGSALRASGEAIMPPARLRIAVFDVKELGRSRVRLRAKQRNVWEGELVVAALPAVTTATAAAGLVQIPAIVSAGEVIEVDVLNPMRTPTDGQWIIAGVPASPTGQDRLRVQLPADLPEGSAIRVSYFDVWGERILDALSPPDVIVRASTSAVTTPRITGCARYGFLGESLCVCGTFPETSRAGLRIDGQPATVIAASRHVVHLRLPASLAPGPHTITGDPSAGFLQTDSASMRALALRAAIDANALMRGESTTMRFAIDGATEPVLLAVSNRTPGIISVPGGNYQELELPPDVNRPVERRVDARSPGNFQIDAQVPVPPCPCMERPDVPSTASQPTPVFVPRRVLAMIAVGTPLAMTATAQAVAAANGLSVVEVTPLPVANAALVAFEILDGIGAVAKAAALAANPNVLLSQPDFVYDTSQASSAPVGPGYGPGLIGADRARAVATGEGIRVAVIDAGIDGNHPRLQKKVVELVDVTGTGSTPDAHGTLVAGVIAADAGDERAPAGVAPGATLVGVKSCVAQSITVTAARCWSSTLARGIDAASQRNVRVMNLSVGGPEDRLLSRMVDAAASKGITVVSAAGNDGPSGKPSYPAAIENVIAVTAVDADSKLYGRATQGAFIDLAAPGVDVLSTAPGGRARIFSGTSAATAFASGAVALLLQRSNLSPSDLRKVLEATARDLGQSGRDTQFGFGLLDVCRAVARASGRGIDCR